MNSGKANKDCLIKERVKTAIYLCILVILIGGAKSYGADTASQAEITGETAISNLELPTYLGAVKNRFKGNNGKYILHINDGDTDYITQQAIGELIKYLIDQYGIDLVSLEGGMGEYDLSLFGRIEDQGTKKRISEHLLRSGMVTGPEYYAINNPDKADLFGIEQEEFYNHNLEYYKEAIDEEKQARELIKEVKKHIANIKRNVYGIKMKEIDRKKKEMKEQEKGEKSYLSFLSDEIKISDKEKDMSKAGAVYELFIKERPTKIAKAKKERNTLLYKVLIGTYEEEAKEILQEIVRFSNGELTTEEFYSMFLELAKQKKVDIREYPALSEYDVYLKKFRDFDLSSFYMESREFETKLISEIATSEELELYNIERDLELLEKMIDFSISESQFKFYLSDRERFSPERFWDFLREKQVEGGTKLLDNADESSTRKYMEIIEKFYKCVGQRNEVFIKNIEKKLSEGREAGTILITSGYHSASLSKSFRDKGYTYLEILPTKIVARRPVKKNNPREATDTLAAGSIFSELALPGKANYRGQVEQLVMASENVKSHQFQGVLDVFCQLFIVDAASSIFKGFSWHEAVTFIATEIMPLFEHLEGLDREETEMTEDKYKIVKFLQTLDFDEKQEVREIFMEYISSEKFLDQVREAIPGVMFQLEQYLEKGDTRIDAFNIHVNGYFDIDALSAPRRKKIREILRVAEYRFFLDDVSVKASTDKQ